MPIGTVTRLRPQPLATLYEGDNYGKLKITTAEVPLPPKNPEIAPEVAATYCFPLSS
jgi:hypothetical protein